MGRSQVVIKRLRVFHRVPVTFQKQKTMPLEHSQFPVGFLGRQEMFYISLIRLCVCIYCSLHRPMWQNSQGQIEPFTVTGERGFPGSY